MQKCFLLQISSPDVKFAPAEASDLRAAQSANRQSWSGGRRRSTTCTGWWCSAARPRRSGCTWKRPAELSMAASCPPPTRGRRFFRKQIFVPTKSTCLKTNEKCRREWDIRHLYFKLSNPNKTLSNWRFSPFFNPLDLLSGPPIIKQSTF